MRNPTPVLARLLGGCALLFGSGALFLGGCALFFGGCSAPALLRRPGRRKEAADSPRSGLSPEAAADHRARHGHFTRNWLTHPFPERQPQAERPRSLFDRADGVTAVPLDGILACQVEVTGHGYDSGLAGGPDVFVQLTIGETELPRTPQSSERVYTYPVEGLRRGEALHLRVVDEDIIFHDAIGDGAALYRGGELWLDASPGAFVRCRPVPAELLVEERADCLHRMRVYTDALSEATPALTETDNGYPQPLVTATVRSAHACLAYMDPADPAFVAEVDRALAFERAWEAQVVAAVDDVDRAGPAPGDVVVLGGGGQARVTDYACVGSARALRSELGRLRPRRPGCVVQIEVTAPPAMGVPDAWGVDRTGRVDDALPIGRRAPGGRWTAPERGETVEAGETIELAYVFDASARPALLRFGGGHRGALMRLKEPPRSP